MERVWKLLPAVMLVTVRSIGAAGVLPLPASGIYLGIQADPALASTQEGAIEIREGPAPNGIGRQFGFHLHYYGWTGLSQQLDSAGVFQPDAQLMGDVTHARVPVISWVCDGTVANSDHVIAAGSAGEDAVITATARALAQFPGPVLLRWFWEFNVLANNQTCRGDTGGTPTPQIYSDFAGAWQHIRTLFQAAGASNVLFLWNPGHYNADGFADDPHGFYPGNSFVDWIGLDTYQRTTTATFSDNFELFYNDFTQSQYGNKPLMVGENGSQNFAQNNIELQATYLQGFLASLQANRYPQLKAYCYFDSGGSAGTWVLDNNNGQGNGGLAAFATLAANQSVWPVPVPPAILTGGVVPVFSTVTTIQPGSWVSIYGGNLAGTTSVWNGDFPTKLGGTSVTIDGKSAYLWLVSPGQINLQAPDDGTLGPVNVVVTTANGSATSTVTLGQAEPSFSLLDASHVAGIILRRDGSGAYGSGANSYDIIGPAGTSLGYKTVPAKAGDLVVLFGVGFGPTNPVVMSGKSYSGAASTITPVLFLINRKSVTPGFSGLSSAGLYQFNLTIPAGLGTGDVPLLATVLGVSTPSTVVLSLQ